MSFFCCLCLSWSNYVDYVLIWTLSMTCELDFVNGSWTMWTMWTLWTIVVYELCGLNVICYVGHLWTCHPCWASMNCYMLCICLNCTYVLRSVEEMEKKCFQAYRASKGGTIAITEYCANDCRASQRGGTGLSHRSRWRDKPITPPMPAWQGLLSCHLR